MQFSAGKRLLLDVVVGDVALSLGKHFDFDA